VTALVLDSHVLFWWSSDSRLLSRRALQAIEAADELAVSGITWYELAWLARRGRITTPMPAGAWLNELAHAVRTVAITPTIAATAASLPSSFPNDPADRLIYASALELGSQLVTKDEGLLGQRYPRKLAVW
jgi:PIN domain nuclease of toxin-antitoxin system